MKKEAFVITADIIKSKSYDDIELVLKHKLDNVNNMFGDYLYTKFTSLKGDEFQAIIERENQSKLMKIIRELKHQMGSQNLRIGVGYGEINSVGNKNSKFGSWEFNGEAFYKARNVVDELRIKRKNSVQMITMFKLFKDDTKNEIMNLLYFNIDSALSKWKEENWIMANYLEKDMTHEEIANIMNKKNNINIDRVNYTKKINRSDWYLIQEIEKLITKIIGEELE
ncbi:MAG: SatD family protein [Acholeplasmataceae bacterium]|nr:SatD family protein [Acholeplasmataceae bacterium]